MSTDLHRLLRLRTLASRAQLTMLNCCAQTLGDTRASEYMKGRKTLEINPDHPIITALQDKVSADADGAKVLPAPPAEPGLPCAVFLPQAAGHGHSLVLSTAARMGFASKRVRASF